MKEDLKNLSSRFIQQVKQKVDLTRFDKDEWFKGAFSTIQRTIRGGLSDIEKKKLRNLLFSSIENLKGFKSKTPNEEDYNKWFDNLILCIKKEIGLSLGQAQKIINILMKYHFCYYSSDCDKKWKEKYSWLYLFFDFFHVPVDNLVLFNLKQKYENESIGNIKV